MSVLIKGMEMPSDEIGQCGYKDIRVWYDGTVEVLDDYHIKEISHKAILVAPHGRLIDADTFYEVLDGGYDLDFDEVPETKRELLRMIIDAPTIIEAEVEE